MTNNERRVGERIPASFEVNYVHDGDYVISYSRDISVDGMFLHTNIPAQLGDISKLYFSLGELKDIAITTKVVWVNYSPLAKETGMAVQFLNATPEIKENLVQLIQRIAIMEKESAN